MKPTVSCATVKANIEIGNIRNLFMHKTLLLKTFQPMRTEKCLQEVLAIQMHVRIIGDSLAVIAYRVRYGDMYRIPLLASWFVTLAAPCLLGQSPSEDKSPLVIADSPDLAAKLIRIGAPTLRIESLFGDNNDSPNQRAWRIREAQLVVSSDRISTDAQFWLERLRGQGVTLRSVSTKGRSSSEEDVLRRLHQIIVLRFPEHRDQFDARLAKELQRLRDMRVATRLAGNL